MKRGDERVLVQCKHWKTYKVGVKVVRKLYGVMAAERATRGMVIPYSVRYWESDSSHGEYAAEIGGWAKQIALDAVVWTNLKVGFKDKRDKLPQYDQVLKHLRSLSHEERAVAEEYVRKAPTQIDTEYRRNLGRDLGWTPIRI